MWNLIALADKNWGIGIDNRLLVQIPEDMRRFREKTMGQAVVMGRKTLESFKDRRILPGRRNIVLTQNPAYRAKGAEIVHSLEELTILAEQAEEEIYVIGGESVYRQLLPCCGTAYITRVDHSYACDAYCPDLDADEAWEMTYQGEEQTYFDLEYSFCRYERKRG